MLYRLYINKSSAAMNSAPAVGIVNVAVSTNSEREWKGNEAAHFMEEFDARAVKDQIEGELGDKCKVKVCYPPKEYEQKEFLFIAISVYTIIHTVAPLKNSRIRLHIAVLSSIPRKAVKTTSIIIPPPVPANPVPKPMVRPKSREIEVLSALRRDHHVHVALEDDCGVRLQALGGRPAGTGAISISGSVSSWSFLRCWLNNIPMGAVVPAFLPRSMRQMARRPNARRQAQPVFHPPRPRGKGIRRQILNREQTE